MLARWLTDRRFLPLCLILFVVLRLGVALLFPVTPVSDSAFYVDRAREMAAGLGYQEQGHPTAYWPVGYPALLAGGYWLTGSMPLTIIALNLAAGLATFWLLGVIGRRVSIPAAGIRFAQLALTLYPNHITYTGQALSEVVYTALILGGMALMLRGPRLANLALAGLVLGFATYVKAQTTAFPLGVLIAMALLERANRRWSLLAGGALLYAVMFATVLPWSLRNAEQLGHFVLVSTNGGPTLLDGNNDIADGGSTNMYANPALKPLIDSLPVPFEDRIARQVEWDQATRAAARAWIADNPGQFAALLPRKALKLWLVDGEGFWAHEAQYTAHAAVLKGLRIANQGYYGFILLLALPGLWAGLAGWLRGDPARAPLLYLSLFAVFTTLVCMAFSGQIRYHFPAMPFLMLAGGWTLMRRSGGLAGGRDRPI